MRRLAPLLIALSLPASALADQCGIVTEDAARKAVKFLADHQQVVHFCEPCGDAAPGPAEELTALGFHGSLDAYQVSVNGKAVDLAYLYAGGRNVAAAASCETTDVSPTLPAAPAPTGSAPPPK